MTTENISKHHYFLEQRDVESIRSFGLIGFDLDGVIIYLQPKVLDIFNSTYNTNFTLEHLTDPWRMSQWYADIHGCSYDEGVEETKKIWNSKEVLETAEMLSGAEEILATLEAQNLGHHFITSRPFYTMAPTQTWFDNRRKGVGFTRMIMQTSNIYNNNHKVETVRNYEIKVFFEDMPEHAQAIVENTQALVVMVTHPWNRNMPDHPRIIRPKGVENEGNLTVSFGTFIDHLKKRRTSG